VPVNENLYDQELTALHAQLAEPVLTAAWSEGRAVTMQQAIAYALGSDDVMRG